jgi:hypothetical protein
MSTPASVSALANIETRTYGLYPTLRAAFENACVAVWLKAPGRRDVRERRLWWAMIGAKNQDRLLRFLGNPVPPKTRVDSRW